MAEETALKFSLKLAEKDIILEDADGKETVYYLKELTGASRDAYMNTMGDKVRYNKKGEFIGMKDYEGLNASLLCKTLFVKESNENVGTTTLQAMPAQVLASLFELSQEMSGLAVEAVEEAGEE